MVCQNVFLQVSTPYIAEYSWYRMLHKSMIVCIGIAAELSSWLLVAVTIERYIAVRFPLRIRPLRSGIRVFFVIIGIFVTLLVFNIPAILVVIKYVVSLAFIASLLQFTLHSYLPALLMLIFNSLIIHCTIRASNRRNTTLQVNISTHEEAERPSQYHGDTRLTILLLCTSFTFVITTFPTSIVLLLFSALRVTIHSYDIGFLLRAIALFLLLLNHSINFYIYSLTGSKFRQELCKVFHCR